MEFYQVGDQNQMSKSPQRLCSPIDEWASTYLQPGEELYVYSKMNELQEEEHQNTILCLSTVDGDSG